MNRDNIETQTCYTNKGMLMYHSMSVSSPVSMQSLYYTSNFYLLYYNNCMYIFV